MRGRSRGRFYERRKNKGRINVVAFVVVVALVIVLSLAFPPLALAALPSSTDPIPGALVSSKDAAASSARLATLEVGNRCEFWISKCLFSFFLFHRFMLLSFRAGSSKKQLRVSRNSRSSRFLLLTFFSS